MHGLLILSRHATEYHSLIDAARLPQLGIVSTTDPADLPPSATLCDVALGEPSLLRDALGRMPELHWVQATWAGVEPLLDPSLRRDYVLTNARGVFGGLMSEYVFGYLLAHERRILEKHAAQTSGRWDATPPGTLRGKQFGLLGVGSIGAALARTAKHFGMRVKGYTRRSEDCPDVDEYFHGGDRQAFASGLDYLVSVMPSTRGHAAAGRRRAARGAARPRGIRESRTRFDRRRGGARRRARIWPAGGRGARRVSAGAAAAGSRVLAHAERADHVAHGGVERAERYRASVRGQLPAVDRRRAAPASG